MKKGSEGAGCPFGLPPLNFQKLAKKRPAIAAKAILYSQAKMAFVGMMSYGLMILFAKPVIRAIDELLL